MFTLEQQGTAKGAPALGAMPRGVHDCLSCWRRCWWLWCQSQEGYMTAIHAGGWAGGFGVNVKRDT